MTGGWCVAERAAVSGPRSMRQLGLQCRWHLASAAPLLLLWPDRLRTLRQPSFPGNGTRRRSFGRPQSPARAGLAQLTWSELQEIRHEGRGLWCHYQVRARKQWQCDLLHCLFAAVFGGVALFLDDSGRRPASHKPPRQRLLLPARRRWRCRRNTRHGVWPCRLRLTCSLGSLCRAYTFVVLWMGVSISGAGAGRHGPLLAELVDWNHPPNPL